MTNNHNGDLQDAKVLIVGAGAMGIATAQRALDAGAVVTLAGRDADRLTRVAGRRPGLNTQVADVDNAEQAAELLGAQAPWDHVAVLTGGAATTASSIVDTPLQRLKGQGLAMVVELRG